MKIGPEVQGNLNLMLGYWGGVKRSKHFLLKAVMLHIKLKGTEYKAIFKLTFSPYTHPQPQDWVNGTKHFFLKVVMFHIKLKGMEHRTPCKHKFCPYTQTHWASGMESKGQNIIF